MFSHTVINGHADNTGTVYTCPECENEVKFYIRDFDKHWNSDFSNLDEKDFIGSPKDQAFLDFYCPECFLPTIVIHGLEAGGMHGEYWYNVENVKYGNAL